MLLSNIEDLDYATELNGKDLCMMMSPGVVRDLKDVDDDDLVT